MHFIKISDMLWLSQVFGNINTADTLEDPQVLELKPSLC